MDYGLNVSRLGEVTVTLLSAPVNSNLPFCETTLLGKLSIPPILLRVSKGGKKYVVQHCFGNRKIYESQCSVKAGFANHSSKLLVDFRKLIISIVGRKIFGRPSQDI